MTEDDTDYIVVVNDEDQYSIWPSDRELPPGWKAEGTRGTKEACMDRIKEIWTEMRPLPREADAEDEQ